MAIRGEIENVLRLPMTSLTEANLENLKNIMKEFN